MHYVGDYIYEPDRLIFYEKDMPQYMVERMREIIEITDHYDKLKCGYDSLDKNHMSAKGKPIDLIGVCLSYNCQLRCNYCSYSSTDGNFNELSTNDVLAFVIEAIKTRKIYEMANHVVYDKPLRFFFTGGGEPTFNWKLFEETVVAIKNKCKQYSIPCYLELTTNGILNDLQRHFIIKYFDKVMLSYDGMPEVQNKNRKCANEKESSVVAVESIKTFMNSKLFLTIRTTIWREDFYLMKEMCDNLAQNFSAIDEWSIMPIVPSGRALLNSTPNQYDVTQKTFFDYYIDLIKYKQCRKYGLYISTAIFNNSVVEYCCGATFNDCFWLMPDKSIINCIEAERFKTEVGKIKNNKVILYDYYEDSYLDTVTDTFTNCRNCLAYRFCKGGCPLKTIRDEQYSTNYRKYECQMIIKYWEYIFSKVLLGEQCFGWKAVLIEKEVFKGYKVYQLKDTKEEKEYEN